MSNQRKFLLVFCFIIFDMFLLIGFLVIRDATLLNNLKKEVNVLAELDITKDRYNRKIKSSGNYAVVESAIKEYLDDYAVNLQDVLKIMNDSRLTTILSYDNYVNDGPNFIDSLNYIETEKTYFNDKIDDLVDRLDEENIKDYIYTKISDPYYVNLYNDLMFNSSISSDFAETKELLLKTKTRVNNVFDVSSEVLNFLYLNQDNWTTENDEIKFTTVELYNTYNQLISKISTKDE